MSIERPHTDYHLRNLDQQTLDALLRIEAILTRAFPEPIAKEEPARENVIEPKPAAAKKGRFSK
jgi:hypothetical protein